ncbi:sigma-54-dependent transcriptional regulator [Flavobacterium anhuiense]|uniref:sigma-54-dependent transcriptional regulator n=1 Tax=Flavobacterium anhuiense TaxID=459526 RepID=UPI003D95C554
MKEKLLIVEDEFIVANDLKIMLQKAGYQVVGIAASVAQALKLIEEKKPDWILLDIILKGNLTGIDLAWELREMNLPFLYISANTNQSTLEAVKATHPYGFTVKPFREKDLVVMLDIARYRFNQERVDLAVDQIDAKNQEIQGIIGQSPLLKEAIEKIKIVAPAETSVLILGESGTGKERAAHAIHELSAHQSNPIVVVNCAALPQSLIESELFGHEKGAFTGANAVRIGKFEQANNGTIFLDEIGELPLDSQVKLLRVLQEKEIQRLGSNKTIKINVRIVAATNKTLEREVAEGRFRLDLYYRLNVFPIQLPSLRERKEDIEVLAYYFLKKYATSSKRNVSRISATALEQLKNYNWPGNVRELEHLIERNVLLAKTNEIENFDLPSSPPTVVLEISTDKLKSMEEMEKEHIMNALQFCNGKVSGSGGAAELLKMQPQTLYSKMKKLGIKQGYN